MFSVNQRIFSPQGVLLIYAYFVGRLQQGEQLREALLVRYFGKRPLTGSGKGSKGGKVSGPGDRGGSSGSSAIGVAKTSLSFASRPLRYKD